MTALVIREERRGLFGRSRVIEFDPSHNPLTALADIEELLYTGGKTGYVRYADSLEDLPYRSG